MLGLHQRTFSKRKWLYFVTNDLPEAAILGFCIFFRDLAFGSDPGRWEEALDPEIDVSDPKIEKRLNQKDNKGPHDKSHKYNTNGELKRPPH